MFLQSEMKITMRKGQGPSYNVHNSPLRNKLFSAQRCEFTNIIPSSGNKVQSVALIKNIMGQSRFMNVLIVKCINLIVSYTYIIIVMYENNAY